MNKTSRIEALRQKPWYSIDQPEDVSSGRGMVHPDERRMLYTLAKDYFCGDGCIIDGGTFLGSSSLALGAGLRDRGYPAGPTIHAFDQFIIDASSIVHHLDHADEASARIKAGDNVRWLYERNIAPVAGHIQIHEGDLTAAPWDGGPIEILFNDVSKSWELNDYILQNWMPSLIPETGILIQQDQIEQHHVWVAITMSMLSDYFETIDYTLNSSMVYRLKRPIPEEAIERALIANVSADDMEWHYKRSLEQFRSHGMGRYTGWRLGMVEIGLAVTYGFHIGDIDKAQWVLDDCKRRFHDVPDTMWRANAIQAHLDAGTPCPGSHLYW